MGEVDGLDEEVLRVKILSRIFLQVADEFGDPREDITWCEDRINESDIEYKRVDDVEDQGEGEDAA